VADLQEVPLEPLDSVPDAEPTAEPEEPTLEAATMLAASLDAYERAHELWQAGDLEGALAHLDRAYELMAQVGVDGDAALGREKEDLRRLIARRIVEVYASQRTVVGDLSASIPKIDNEHVRREIASFQGGERQEFLDGYLRSGAYRPMIEEALREAGLPEQLAWMPMVESWFKVRALSTARALGMWQFIPSTGYRFGLERSDWFDERMDPEKSTRGAIAYLTELHEMFGDWLTALAAYNCGETRVMRTINSQRISYFDQFWDLYELLPRETRRYVPRFLAVLEILEDPARYGFDDLPEPLPALTFDTVSLARSVTLADLEGELGLPEGVLPALNPELRRSATPPTAYELKVPTDLPGEALLAALEELPRYTAPVVDTTVHVVGRGESLSVIADRYRTSVSSLMRLNGLSNPNRLRVGQRLNVVGAASAPAAASSGPTTYTVRGGDSLWRIASRYGTTVDQLRRDNGISGSRLSPGQSLVVRAGSGGSSVYVVRRGDTLGGIASDRSVPVGSLAEANGLSLRSTIYPGQRLLIPK
jgi:membrane-bound lytic murein transglycosylase D